MNKIIPYEEEEQIAFVQWLELMKLKFTSIPNSTWSPSYNQHRKNRAMGLRLGLPDLLIIVPHQGRKHLVFVEMKRIKNSKTAPEQLEWIRALRECEGVDAKVCRGFEEAKLFIQELIS